MRFRKASGKFCVWGGVIPCTNTGWGLSSWKAALQDLVVLVDDKLNTSQQCDFTAKVANPTMG